MSGYDHSYSSSFRSAGGGIAPPPGAGGGGGTKTFATFARPPLAVRTNNASAWKAALDTGKAPACAQGVPAAKQGVQPAVVKPTPSKFARMKKRRASIGAGLNPTRPTASRVQAIAKMFESDDEEAGELQPGRKEGAAGQATLPPKQPSAAFAAVARPMPAPSFGGVKTAFFQRQRERPFNPLRSLGDRATTRVVVSPSGMVRVHRTGLSSGASRTSTMSGTSSPLAAPVARTPPPMPVPAPAAAKPYVVPNARLLLPSTPQPKPATATLVLKLLRTPAQQQQQREAGSHQPPTATPPPVTPQATARTTQLTASPAWMALHSSTAKPSTAKGSRGQGLLSRLRLLDSPAPGPAPPRATAQPSYPPHVAVPPPESDSEFETCSESSSPAPPVAPSSGVPAARVTQGGSVAASPAAFSTPPTGGFGQPQRMPLAQPATPEQAAADSSVQASGGSPTLEDLQQAMLAKQAELRLFEEEKQRLAELRAQLQAGPESAEVSLASTITSIGGSSTRDSLGSISSVSCASPLPSQASPFLESTPLSSLDGSGGGLSDDGDALAIRSGSSSPHLRHSLGLNWTTDEDYSSSTSMDTGRSDMSITVSEAESDEEYVPDAPDLEGEDSDGSTSHIRHAPQAAEAPIDLTAEGLQPEDETETETEAEVEEEEEEEEEDPLFCALCDYRFATVKNKQRHLLSKRHAKSVERFEAAQEREEEEEAEGEGEGEMMPGVERPALQLVGGYSSPVARRLRVLSPAQASLETTLDSIREDEGEGEGEEEDGAADVSAVSSDSIEALALGIGQVSLAESQAPPREATPLDRLLVQCGQTSMATFTQAFGGNTALRTAWKVGEGTFAEVFVSQCNGDTVAFKVMPIEGSIPVNGEPQQTATDIMGEVVVSQELSRLCEGVNDNATDSFIGVHSVKVCRGAFPKALLSAWDEWAEAHESENDRPDLFDKDQLFIVFAFTNGGTDFESFKFKNLRQAQGMLVQTCVGLAVAEVALEFEHRDLHWGNVLLLPTTEKKKTATIDGRSVTIQTGGVDVSIIDFTLSRLRKDEGPFFLDLESDDWLFKGEGDMQFDVYREMRAESEAQWEGFHPRTNVFWIRYMADKILSAKSYKGNSKRDRAIQKDLTAFLERVDGYESARAALSDPVFAHDLSWAGAGK